MQTREPNGRHQRGGEEREFAPTKVWRLINAALGEMADPMFGTMLGRLALTRKITATQFATGLDFAEKAARYQDAILAPAQDPKAISLERGSVSHPVDVDSVGGRAEAKRHAHNKEVFLEAITELLELGPRTYNILRAVCERNQACTGTEEISELRKGLDRLAVQRRPKRRN